MKIGPMGNRSVLKKIGANVRAIRKEKGLSQERLAVKAGLDRTYVGSIERGEKNISVLSLEKLAKALGMSLEEVFQNTNPKKR